MMFYCLGLTRWISDYHGYYQKKNTKFLRPRYWKWLIQWAYKKTITNNGELEEEEEEEEEAPKHAGPSGLYCICGKELKEAQTLASYLAGA